MILCHKLLLTMKFAKKLCPIAFLLLFSFAFSYAIDKDKLFEQLKNKLEGTAAIKVQFFVPNSNYTGILTFAKPNKFRLELRKNNQTERILVSNGTTLWNYSLQDKKVVVSNVESSDDADLQNFFANFANNLVPVSLSKTNRSDLGSSLVLLLRAKENKQQSIRIFLDDKNNIKAIEFATDAETQFYRIKSLRTDVNVPGKFFEFRPPAKVEVIDLR